MIPKDFDLTDKEGFENLSLVDQAEVIRRTVTVAEVAEMFGLEPDSSDKITSPFNPDEHTPSCHLYDDHFYDYGTGRWGDVFDLVVALQPGMTAGGAIWKLWHAATGAGYEFDQVEQAQPRQLLDFTNEYGQAGHPVDVLLGLDVRPFGLLRGPEGAIFVPHREPGRVYGVKIRYPASSKKGSWAGSQYTHRLYDPYGWAPTPFAGPNVIITEGESDSWAMATAVDPFYRVLALPSGSSAWKDHWLTDLEIYSTVWICMDNDEAGKRARDKIALKVGYERAEVLKVPQLFNDAREAIAAGWDPTDRLESF